MKIIVSDGQLGTEHIERLRRHFPAVTFATPSSVEEQVREIADADAYIGTPTNDVFRAAGKLRWVHCVGTGVDAYYRVVPDLFRGDVVLTNARGPHAPPMADHAFALLLGLTHRLPWLLADQRSRRWDIARYWNQMVELEGRTMVVHALGGIGQAVARRALGFGMTVYGVDARPTEPPPGVAAVWGPERLDEALALADVFVETAPLTPKTRGLLDARRLALLKPSSYLIVISRGGIVDEPALIELLRAGRIAGAGLDVAATEPLPHDSPLWDMENVIISPHVSANTPEMYEGRRRIVAENVRRFVHGEPLLYVVDKSEGY